MKKLLITIVFFLTIGSAVAQKKLITQATPGIWPIIRNPAISNDGRFVKYEIDIPDSGSTLLVTSTDHKIKMNFHNVTSSAFAGDSRKLIFMKKDSLGICELGTSKTSFRDNVSRFSISQDGDGRYLACQGKGLDKKLVVLDLITGKIMNFSGVMAYSFNKMGTVLLLTTNANKTDWLDLTSGKTTILCGGCQAKNFTFNDSGNALGFLTKTNMTGHAIVSLRYYRAGMDSAAVVVDPSTPGMKGMLISDNSYVEFNKFGNRLFFYIKYDPGTDQKKTVGFLQASSKVEIKGFADKRHNYEFETGHFWAEIDLSELGKGIIRLQNDSDKDHGGEMDKNGHWFVTESGVISTGGNSYTGEDGGTRVTPDIYLISTEDGSRHLIKKRAYWQGRPLFSPGGKYLLWFDQIKGQWYSYNIASGKTIEITTDIKTPMYGNESINYFTRSSYEIGGWLKNDKAVLLYDRYDLWQVDPEGLKPPINLTHSPGERDSICFRLVSFAQSGDTLLLSAFDLNTKDDGYYRLILQTGKMEELVMGPKKFTQITSDFDGGAGNISPVKAKNANTWLTVHMSATEYPNLYTTHDFRQFTPITNLEPQEMYNWYTSELIHWTLPDKNTAEGLLYKPEDFDPNKRYPVIFYYYEKNAYNLNMFINPVYSMGNISIPWFVSNGYIVCVPDIYYKLGHPGQSALESVESAARYLSQFTWVDAQHMGLQGHSYGGQETDYIMSHSTLFAAAAPASGVSDEVSLYNELGGQDYDERGQGRYGATLWQRPDLYIENSAIFNLDKVICPVFIMTTELDWGVPHSQALQLYYGLIRLGKKVWMANYTDEDHSLFNPRNQLDYSIRLSQFFDHYLKSAPAPYWMTGNIPPKFVTTDEGLQLDTAKNQP